MHLESRLFLKKKRRVIIYHLATHRFLDPSGKEQGYEESLIMLLIMRELFIINVKVPCTGVEYLERPDDGSSTTPKIISLSQRQPSIDPLKSCAPPKPVRGSPLRSNHRGVHHYRGPWFWFFLQLLHTWILNSGLACPSPLLPPILQNLSIQAA